MHCWLFESSYRDIRRCCVTCSRARASYHVFTSCVRVLCLGVVRARPRERVTHPNCRARATARTRHTRLTVFGFVTVVSGYVVVLIDCLSCTVELDTLMGLSSPTLWAASPYYRLFEDPTAHPQHFVDATARFQRFFKPKKSASSSDQYYELVGDFAAPSHQRSDTVEEYILTAIEAFQERYICVWPPRGTATADNTPRPCSPLIWGRMCTSFEAWTSMSYFHPPFIHFVSLPLCCSRVSTVTDDAGRRLRSAWFTITESRTDIPAQWLPERGTLEQLEDEYAYYIFAPNAPASVDVVATRMRWLCLADDLPYAPHHSESTIRALDRLFGAVDILSQRADRLNWPLRGGVRNHLALLKALLNTFKSSENGLCLCLSIHPFHSSHSTSFMFLMHCIHSTEAQANARALADVGMHREDRSPTSQPAAPYSEDVSMRSPARSVSRMDQPVVPLTSATPRTRADDDAESSSISSVPPDEEVDELPAMRMTRSASLRTRGNQAGTSSSRAPSTSSAPKSSSRAPSASSAPSGSGSVNAPAKSSKRGKKSSAIGEQEQSSNRGKASKKKKKMPNLRNELV